MSISIHSTPSGEDFEASLDGLTIYADFGDGGRLSYTTEGRCFAGAVPWIDGDLIEHNTLVDGFTDSVHTRIGGKARCVGYNPPTIDGGAPFGALTDGYFVYTNSVGQFTGTLYFDPTETVTSPIDGTGYDETATLTGVSQWEVELQYNFGPVIGRAQYNELEDLTLWAIFPMPQQGLFSFIRYEDQLAEDTGSGNYHRWTFFSQWRTMDLGAFRGVTAIYQADDSTEGTGWVLQANFGGSDWNASFAFDKDYDFAIEGSYAINDMTSIEFGYDGGCDAGDCFNANAGFGSAAAQSATWAVALAMTF